MLDVRRTGVRGLASVLGVIVMALLGSACTTQDAPVPQADVGASCAALKDATTGGGGGDAAADAAVLEALRAAGPVDPSLTDVRTELTNVYDAIVSAREGQPEGAELANYGELDGAIAAASRRLNDVCP